MNDPKDNEYAIEIHIEMWRHYDSLRQAKNNGFLTANSFLAAIAGFLYEQTPQFALLISLTGIAISVSWFLLLNRNSDYIEYHRKIAGRGQKDFWMPKSRTPRSKYLDRTPLVAFFIVWLVFLIFSVVSWRCG
jgi:hypothetical protein